MVKDSRVITPTMTMTRRKKTGEIVVLNKTCKSATRTTALPDNHAKVDQNINDNHPGNNPLIHKGDQHMPESRDNHRRVVRKWYIVHIAGQASKE
eukprot:scaffold166065_cov21-Prasinocladus_malaysianus.AAC.2